MMLRHGFTLLLFLSASGVLLPGCSGIASQRALSTNDDVSVSISAAFGGGRVAGRQVYTLRRIDEGFVIERRTHTTYEHLKEAVVQWPIAPERVDSVYAAVVHDGFFARPDALEPRGRAYDCWGWDLTVRIEESVHKVHVPCFAEVPEAFAVVARQFAAAGAEPLHLHGLQ